MSQLDSHLSPLPTILPRKTAGLPTTTDASIRPPSRFYFLNQEKKPHLLNFERHELLSTETLEHARLLVSTKSIEGILYLPGNAENFAKTLVSGFDIPFRVLTPFEWHLETAVDASRLNPSFLGLDVLFYKPLSPQELDVWNALLKRTTSVAVHIVVSKEYSVEDILLSLPSWSRKEVHLCFPFAEEDSPVYYSELEMTQLIFELHRLFPTTLFAGPRGWEIPHPDSRWEKKNVNIAPLWQSHSADFAPKISVVIPCYNSQKELKNTLYHLFRQNLSHKYFEVIVVDDGSPEPMGDWLKEQIPQWKGFNVSYIFYPREKARVLGDSSFRAGPARNVGAANAKGEILLFLDCDILLPNHYLSLLQDSHKRWDVIQGQRWELVRQPVTDDFLYDSISSRAELTNEKYWADFIGKKDRWNQLLDSWKYVCSHSLSMKKSDFFEVGSFSSAFCFYGYEDTELGYRLWSRGKKFQLSSAIVLHQPQGMERSEFKNQKTLRYKLLRESCRVFLRIHPTVDVSNHSQWLYRTFPRKRFKTLPAPENTIKSWPNLSHPRISVVIPTVPKDHRVLETIQSIAKQTFLKSDVEVLVVCNQPDLALKGHLKARRLQLPGLHYLCTYRMGTNIARNYGAENARGQVIVFLDDDILVKDKHYLQNIWRAHEEAPAELAIGGPYALPDRYNLWDEVYHIIGQRWMSHSKGPFLLGGNCSFKRALVDMGAEFKPSITWGGTETELEFRLKDLGYSMMVIKSLPVEHRGGLRPLVFLRKAFLQGLNSKKIKSLEKIEGGFFYPDRYGSEHLYWGLKWRLWIFDFVFSLGHAWSEFKLNPNATSFRIFLKRQIHKLIPVAKIEEIQKAVVHYIIHQPLLMKPIWFIHHQVHSRIVQPLLQRKTRALLEPKKDE